MAQKNLGTAKQIPVSLAEKVRVEAALERVTQAHYARCELARRRSDGYLPRDFNNESIEQMNRDLRELIGDRLADEFEAGPVRLITEGRS